MNRTVRTVLASLALAAFALTACSGDGDETAVDTTSAGTETVSSTETVVETTAPRADVSTTVGTATTGIGPVAGVVVGDSFPPDADVVVDATATSDDRVVRRGGQSLIAQGQTFVAPPDGAGLDAVSFAVIAAATIPAGTPLALGLYEVADPRSAIPSENVPIDGDDQLVVDLPQDLVDGALSVVTFEFPTVALNADASYAVVLSFGDGAPAVELFVQHTVDDVIEDGVAIRFEGSTWKPNRVGDQAIALRFAD